MRDKIAEVIMANRAVDNWQGPTPADFDAADAIVAALPGMVPELVWEGFYSGPYKIEVHEGGIIDLWFCGCAIKEDGENELLRSGYLTLVSMDDLKAAANTHHAAQVMAAFGVVL